MSATPPVPEVGTRAVHKEDYAKMKGPVWEVYGTTVPDNSPTPETIKVGLGTANHKLNEGLPAGTKVVPLKEFREDYKTL